MPGIMSLLEPPIPFPKAPPDAGPKGLLPNAMQQRGMPGMMMAPTPGALPPGPTGGGTGGGSLQTLLAMLAQILGKGGMGGL